jgi:hypothetical protein
MAEKIKCKTPSTGRVKNYTYTNIPVKNWITIAEAPYFSVPDARRVYADRDPEDITRGLRSGEIFFMTPVFIRNTTFSNLPPGVTGNTTVETTLVEIRLVTESGTTIACPGIMTIPPGDTAMVPVQGRSLVKRNFNYSDGDKLQIYVYSAAGTGSIAPIQIWASAEEKPSSEHTGVE